MFVAVLVIFVIFVGIPVFIALLGLVFVRARRSRHERREARDRMLCQVCKYPMHGLGLPRCPECGTLRGFDCPMSELGLTEREMKSIQGEKVTIQPDDERPPGPPKD